MCNRHFREFKVSKSGMVTSSQEELTRSTKISHSPTPWEGAAVFIHDSMLGEGSVFLL